MRQTKKEFDFKNVPKLHNLINNVAGIIVKDIKEGITRRSEDIHGNPFKPISKEWASKKGHDAPLIHKGKMKEVYIKTRASQGSTRAEIGMNVRDRKIASVVHNQGLPPHKKREWFGVSDKAEKKADKMVKQWMKLKLYMAGKK